MFAQPNDSPWGQVDYCDVLCPGVFLVYTHEHGGTMIARDIEEIMSPAARRYGQRKNGFICFEQDADEEIVFRELLDKKLWEIPARVRDRAAFEEISITRCGEITPGIGVRVKTGAFMCRPLFPRPPAPNDSTSGQVVPKPERRIRLCPM